MQLGAANDRAIAEARQAAQTCGEPRLVSGATAIAVRLIWGTLVIGGASRVAFRTAPWLCGGETDIAQ
ncbi:MULTISPECIES: hypothetical protein [unclassified Sphingomonas]|uniref:hypothetical protein n=1 Tax=unclassified Sphingomonas TaxID=196159 RepID=UPI0006F2B3EF|nr:MULTISPECIES: hypothetical protein [unclassified Sphingomonas]KQX19454.1 hypothetical protein ASD17_13055 [Sphingomonas sp. Root1294]KQY65655.1 hypothetical protein ASD39_16255 [Sphingomonas sp. Root50]KRB95041.1 hypothetical protein ASE22_03800 [Sphingomonas sp. Root720]